MTFTTKLKDEISKADLNDIEQNASLCAYILAIGKFSRDGLSLTSENASVTRKIYKELKSVFNVNPRVIVRIQKRFRVKQIYILNVKENIDVIKKALDTYKKDILTILLSDEEKVAYLQGSFLSVGTVSDPKSKGYHLEFTFSLQYLAKNVYKLLKHYGFYVKTIERGYKYIVYIKASENISDLIKLFGATNSLFYFEDIRIYRDHKNMVNRLNNCEVANQEKIITTGLRQMEDIRYLKENDLMDLLDEKTKITVEMREKYPEASLAELASIITGETDYKIGKSGINHQFIKIGEIVKRHEGIDKSEI
jgi:cell division protein WhiA